MNYKNYDMNPIKFSQNGLEATVTHKLIKVLFISINIPEILIHIVPILI